MICTLSTETLEFGGWSAKFTVCTSCFSLSLIHGLWNMCPLIQMRLFQALMTLVSTTTAPVLQASHLMMCGLQGMHLSTTRKCRDCFNPWPWAGTFMPYRRMPARKLTKKSGGQIFNSSKKSWNSSCDKITSFMRNYFGKGGTFPFVTRRFAKKWRNTVGTELWTERTLAYREHCHCSARTIKALWKSDFPKMFSLRSLLN